MVLSKNNFAWGVVGGACLLALAACSGGSKSSGGTSNLSLSGTVMDGYIKGATVFLDLNNNQTQDSNEPSATTQAGGAYSLNTSDLTTAQISAAHIVTVVPESALDEDDGGKTLKEAHKKSYTLMAPAAAYAVAADGSISAAVVSPLTTMVSHTMISDGSMTVAQATTSAQATLGLDSNTSLTQDVTKDSKLHKKSQIIAAAIGQVQDAVQTTTSTSTTNKRDTLFAALTYVQNNWDTLEQAVNNSTSGTSVNDAVTSATSSSGAAPINASSLVAAAQQITNSTVSNWGNLIAEGFYNGNCLLESSSNCSTSYSKISGDGTASGWKQSNYSLDSNKSWGPSGSSSSSSDSCVLNSTGCVSSTRDSGTYTVEGNTATVTDGKGWNMRVTLRSQDVSGKKWGDISSFSVPANYANTVFPTGSHIHYMSAMYLQPEYRLSSNFVPQGYGSNSAGASFTSLAALVTGKRTPANNTGSVEVEGTDGLHFTFNEAYATANTNNGGTVTLYRCSDANQESGGCNVNGATWQVSGSANYVLESVYGYKVLRILAPYNADNHTVGTQLIYSLRTSTGVVHGGQYTPANVANQFNINLDKTAFGAILQAANLPAVVN